MRNCLLILLTLFVSTLATAQGLRFNAYGASAFDDKVDSYYSSTSSFSGTLKGGFLWGAGIESKVRPDMGVELLYQRLDSHAPMTYYDGSILPKTKTFDYGLNYIMLAGNRYMQTGNDKVEPYGGLMLGAAIFDVKNPEPNGSSSFTKFAWGARLGATIWAAEKVGIRFQAQLTSAVQSIGGGLYFGTGGSGAGVSTYSSMLQFSIGGGLVFKIK